MKDRLVTPGYCFILAANFLLYFALAIDTRIAILSIRSIQCRKLHYRHHSFLLYGSCLMLRPFSGYFLDSFARKPLYLLAYFIFMTMFAGYIIAGSLTYLSCSASYTAYHSAW